MPLLLSKNPNSDIGWWNSGEIFIEGRFVRTTADLNTELSKVITFSTIFNTWERFRVGGTAGEENAWTYNSSTDRVICTINSSGFIGFASIDKYDNYSHEATLSSIDADDDLIGILAAYHKDPGTGKIYTLHATRSSKVGTSGCGPGWGVIYNWAQADQVILFSEDNVMKANLGWSTAGSTRLRITRAGDIITCETTNWGNVTTYNTTYKYTIDLATNPILSIFRGPKQYGYCCQSQNQSTFSNIVFSDISSMIFDLANKRVYVFKNGAWAVDASKNIANIIGEGKFLFNPTTKKLFFIKDINNITNII